MTHDEIRDLVLLLRDGELPASDRAAAEEHLSACASCRELMAASDAVGSAFAGEPLPEPSESFVSSVMDALEEETPVRDGIELPFRWWAPAFAFGLAGLVMLLASPEPRQRVTVETLLTAAGGAQTNEADTQASDVADVLGMSLEEL